MFGSDILEVAIGLAMVFVLGGLLCSTLNEAVLGGLLNVRAADLWEGLKRVVQDERFAERVRSHPLIACLRGGSGKALTYIPSWTFADTVLALIPSAGSKPLPSLADPAASSGTGPAVSAQGDPLVSLKAAIRARLEADPSASADAAHPGAASLEALPRSTAAALEALLLTCTDIHQARTRMEQWFNAGMDRVSGEYKRKAQVWLTLWASAVVLLANIDAIDLAEHFYRDPALRRAMVDAAPGVMQAVAPMVMTNAMMAAGQDLDASMASLTNAIHRVSLVTGQVQGLGLPIGWSATTEVTWRRILGWILSIAAFAMGAPFWFDLLNKMVNLRAGGPPPPASPPAPAQASVAAISVPVVKGSTPDH
jgi:hypothetical protein